MRTEWESGKTVEKKAYLVRKQEEREELRALKDYLLHKAEDDDTSPEIYFDFREGD